MQSNTGCNIADSFENNIVKILKMEGTLYRLRKAEVKIWTEVGGNPI